MTDFTTLSDDDLAARLRRAVARERRSLADVLEALAEADRRKLYAACGCTSLLAYCARFLGYSEKAAAWRIHAARRNPPEGFRREPAPEKPYRAEEARRHVPQWVKDEVWRRDQGRCVFVGADGLRCAARESLEYDHAIPYALGGPSNNPGNIRLLCRDHNRHLARRLFGSRQ